MIKQINHMDIILFTKKMSTLLDSNIDIVNSLNIIYTSTENKDFKILINKILDKLKEGLYFSKAIEEYPDYFNKFYINMVKIGEDSGELSRSLSMIYDYEYRKFKFRRKVISALFYPGLLIVATIFLVIFMLTMILPIFEDIYSMYDMEIPKLTKFLLAAFKLSKYIILALFILLCIMILVHKNKKEDLYYYWGKILYRIPIVRDISEYSFTIQFSSLLNLLILSDIPIVKSMDLIEATIENLYLKESFKYIKQDISKGELLSKSLKNEGLIARSAIDLIQVGEETGEISNILETIQLYYLDKLNDLLYKISSLIEPILILLVGSIIAFTLITITSPIFNVMPIIN